MLPLEREMLYKWISNINPKIVLELGTGSGASSYYILNSLNNGKLISCDPNRRSQIKHIEEDYDNFDFRNYGSTRLIDELINTNIVIDFLFFDGPDIPTLSLDNFKILDDFVNIGCYFTSHDWEIEKRKFDGCVCVKNKLLRPYIEASDKWDEVDMLDGIVCNKSVGLCLYKKVRK